MYVIAAYMTSCMLMLLPNSIAEDESRHITYQLCDALAVSEPPLSVRTH
jgi:hypothetical protein